MDEKKVQQLQQAFMMVDNICAQTPLTRAQNQEVTAALKLIADTINEAVLAEQPEE